jgi:hypothetical protein
LAETFSTRGLKALFSYPFRHANWDRKMLVLVLLCVAGIFVPILPWIPALGYMAEIMSRSAAGEGDPDLPEWNDWGRLFVDGLRVGGAGLIAMLPLILVFSCGFGTYFISLIGAIAQDTDGRSSGFPIFMMGGYMVFMFTLLCGFLLSLLIMIPFPAFITHVAYKKSFSSLFHVAEWWQIFRSNIGGFLIGVVLLWAASFLLQIVVNILVSTVVLCVVAFIAPAVISPYLMVIAALLYGQIYHEGLENLKIKAPPPVEDSPAI